MDSTSLKAAASGSSSSPFPLKITSADQQIERRYTDERPSEPVTFEFTRDPALLHQYYILREKMFISVWGLKKFYGGKDEFDEMEDTLIARTGRLCIGGARFIFSSPKRRALLPMEKSGLNPSELFPELDLTHKTYGEVSRFALLPEFRTREISQHMLYLIAQQHIRNKADYGFWIAPLVAARSYRKTFATLGVNCRICSDVVVQDKPQYEGIKMFVGMMDFTSAPVQAQEAAREPAEA